MNLFAQHRDSEKVRASDFEYHLRRLRSLIDTLSQKDRTLTSWYLQGDSVSEALRFNVYIGSEPSAAAVAELHDEYKGKVADVPRSVGIWNGMESADEGATAYVSFDGGNVLSQTVDLMFNEKGAGFSRLGNYKDAADVVAKAVEVYEPFYTSFGPRKYSKKAVFEDRPGASWMLYLPHVLTSRQVPEARDLIPVLRDGNQQGTIIVSVTDAVFDFKNRDHVKAANEIEVRLADQDLLPRFVDL
ncbi:immunity 52 family protein [Paraburkholderia sp. DGU8]|uniref:immunity 52 family protein n=1 Tax=Paraburkholderia sp. DGU8 TaxID=3161997 RepID=UPI0034677CE5